MRWAVILLLFMACSPPRQQPVVMQCDAMSEIMIDNTRSYYRVLPPERASVTMSVFLDSIVFDGAYENTLYIESFIGAPMSGQFMCMDAHGGVYMVMVSSEGDAYAIDVINEHSGVYLSVDTTS